MHSSAGKWKGFTCRKRRKALALERKSSQSTLVHSSPSSSLWLGVGESPFHTASKSISYKLMSQIPPELQTCTSRATVQHCIVCSLHKGAWPKGFMGLRPSWALLTRPCALVGGYVHLKERIPFSHLYKGTVRADEKCASWISPLGIRQASQMLCD